MNAGTELCQTRHTDRAVENAMGDAHAPVWRRVISLAPETDLSTLDVFDVGCNQDGFRRLLHDLHPFYYGEGVDIARDSIEAFYPGDIHYAVTGCHTANPLWPAWRTLVTAHSNAPVRGHTLEDDAAAPAAPGFDVSVKRFEYDGFVPAGKGKTYDPCLTGAFGYPNRYKRCAFPAGAD